MAVTWGSAVTMWQEQSSDSQGKHRDVTENMVYTRVICVNVFSWGENSGVSYTDFKNCLVILGTSILQWLHGHNEF